MKKNEQNIPFCNKNSVILRHNSIQKHSVLRRIRHLINISVWVLVGTYLILTVLLNIPAVKVAVAEKAGEMLSEKLGTEVKIGKVDVSIFNRIVLDGVSIKDQKAKELLTAPRISVGWSVVELLKGRISISSAQIFGMKANLYRETATAETNFQFIIDSLSSKPTADKGTFNLQISSLIIRRSQIAYDQLDSPLSGQFSPKHLRLKDISAHVILNKLTNDSLDLNIKKLAFNEGSGLVVKKLTAKFAGGKSGARLSDFRLALPNSVVAIPDVTVRYAVENNKLKPNSLSYKASISDSYVSLGDFNCFYRQLSGGARPVYISADIQGSDTKVALTDIRLTQLPGLLLLGDAYMYKVDGSWKWEGTVEKLHTDATGLRSIAANIGKQDILPSIIDKLGEISVTGKATGMNGDMNIDGKVNTAVGNATMQVDKKRNLYTAEVTGKDIDVATLAGSSDLGLLDCTVTLDGQADNGKIAALNATADIEKFAYRNHNYHNIGIKANRSGDGTTVFSANLNDDCATVNIDGSYDTSTSSPRAQFTLNAKNVSPSGLGLTDKWGNSTFDLSANGDIRGTDINNSEGQITVRDFAMHSDDGVYRINSLDLQKQSGSQGMQRITLISDFGKMSADGQFDYNTVLNSLTAAIHKKLPTIPWLPKGKAAANKINLYATIHKTDWAEKLLGVPLQIGDDAHIIVNIDDNADQTDINIDIPDFTYNDKTYRNGYLIVTSPGDTLKAKLNVTAIGKRGDTAHYLLNAKAADNHLVSQARFDIHGRNAINGQVNTDAHFYNSLDGQATAHLNVLKSDILIGDTVWTVKPSSIEYVKNRLTVNDLSICHGDQEVRINGMTAKDSDEEIKVHLKDVNVAYILDMVNFHSVEFSGYATGYASIRSLFTKPSAEADLDVSNFMFERGSLGRLHAKADWNKDDGTINIDATAEEDEGNHTVILGYISPKNKNIDLHITAAGSSLNFLRSYCNSFASDIDLRGWGNINVVGPLSAIQLIGDAWVSGSTHITSLNATYSLNGARVKLNPDDIIFYNDTIFDRNGNIGVMNGHLRHQHLGKFTYDIDIAANNLLAYDTHDFGDDVFYGTAYATGKCDIKGKSGEVIINVEATPGKNSQIVYDATSQNTVSNSEFIVWNDRNRKDEEPTAGDDDGKQAQKTKLRTNLYLNMLIHCTPDATLKVLMDRQTGDCISLNGSGAIRTAYYNKGSFDMFGNYVVSSGTYNLTIQNVIKRDFNFLSGGTIAFGGNAYNALLDLKAQYTLNSVPLSDINLGKSFLNNNIRVDCIMNISGTPSQPHVDFSLDMPTVSTDAKQMVMSVMNSNEEINQQVLYLLAIGRFMNQNNNSSTAQSQRQSQTSLAMQSILSGTVSQQLSNVLEAVIDNKQWNLGANISTGDEGFNNAEYEGLVSGRLLNNRLLINGQFGYRDNQNATSTFIGDFDIQYLLVPSGNIAVRVYNQTNDKYFTKNSLNTQGIGLIFKKDFNGWRDFFRWSRKRK
jgi:hypothetical protein